MVRGVGAFEYDAAGVGAANGVGAAAGVGADFYRANKLRQIPVTWWCLPMRSNLRQLAAQATCCPMRYYYPKNHPPILRPNQVFCRHR